MHIPRTTVCRHKLGIRHKWLQDRRCAKYGHLPDATVTVGVLSGAYWPICTRCGYGIEPGVERRKHSL